MNISAKGTYFFGGFMNLSTKPKLIYNKNKETIDFCFYFPIKTDYKNIHYVRLLDYILSTTSKKYPDSSSFEEIKKQKLLISNSIYLETNEETSFIVYVFTIPRENILKDYNIDETFAFAISLIIDPYVENNEFNENKFYYEKDYFVEKNRIIMDDPINKMNEEFYNIVDKKEYLGCSYLNSTKMLKDITPESLYEFYKENIKENKCLKYVYGNINNKKLNYLFEKYYKQEDEVLNINIKKYKNIPESKSIDIIKNVPLEQSYIYLEYKVKEFTENDRLYLKIINNFLYGPSNDLLFKKLRIEKNIVYSFSLIRYLNFGLFVVRAGIDEKNKNEFIHSVNDTLIGLQSFEVIKDCLNKLIDGLKVDLLRAEDSENFKLANIISDDLEEDTLKRNLEEYKNADIDKIYGVLKKIELKNIVFFRGVK